MLGAVALAQGAALFVYRHVERTRARVTPFRSETMSSREPALLLEVERPDAGTVQVPRRGTAVLLHFWATWCPPCREELPGLLALGRDLARQGLLEIVAISVDDDWATIERFFGGPVPEGVVRAHARSEYKRYGVSTLPDSYLVSSTGHIVARYAGPRNWSSREARQAIVHALAEPSKAPTAGPS